MNSTQYLLSQEQRRVAGLASAARQRISGSRSIGDLVRHGSISIRAEFRSLKHLFTDLKEVERAMERRAGEIVAAQLLFLEESISVDDFRRKAGKLRAGEWRQLSGNFPRLAHLVKTESARIEHRLALGGTEEGEPETILKGVV